MSELSRFLTKLKKAELVVVAEAALLRLSPEDRDELLAGATPAKKPKRRKRAAPDPSSFRETVRTFVDESFAGAYYQCTGEKNERGFYKTPEATDRWCSEVERLCADALKLARAGHDEVVAEALELLLDVMAKSEGDREIVFAEEWGVSWMVHADFKKLLKVYFETLSRTAPPDDFARRGAAIAKRWTWESYDAEKLLRHSAKGEHLAALKAVLKQPK